MYHSIFIIAALVSFISLIAFIVYAARKDIRRMMLASVILSCSALIANLCNTLIKFS